MISLRFEVSKVLQRLSAVLRNYLLTSTVSLYSFSYRSGNCGMDSNDQILVNLLHLNHYETIDSRGARSTTGTYDEMIKYSSA